MKTNKEKIRAWRKAQQEQVEQIELVEKAKRRHYGTPHAFIAWGKAIRILNAIHREIEPKLATIRSAEDFLNYGNGKQRKAAKQ